MNNKQLAYQQPPIGQMPWQGKMMPPRQSRPRNWRERMMRRWGMDMSVPLGRQERILPHWVVNMPVVFFFVSMFACWIAFGYVPEASLWMAASISVLIFFFGGSTMARQWEHASEKRFIRNVFFAGFVIRVLWVTYCYLFFNMDHYGFIYGDNADTGWYMDFGKDLATWLSGESKMSLMEMIDSNGSALDDVGYPMWLAVGYVLWNPWSDAFMPMLVKCLCSAYCAVCIYHIAQRHFGEGAARLAALFVCLNPNMIYWCGNMFKEAEMVFLCCAAVDNFDRVLTSGQRFTIKNLLPGMLAAIVLMFFRMALGLVVFLALFAHIVMASNRIMSLGKKILAGVLVSVVLLVAMGDRMVSQSQELLNRAQSDHQQTNMEWRAERDGGNNFAKYAGAAVFAPLIFTIPFPTFNAALETQYLQVQLSGGSYIKNILSFFVILVMILMLISGEWRRHVFILAYTMGYLMVLVMSEFAHSGRFHMPIWPMLMLFAAYGIQMGKGIRRIRRWLPMVLVLEVVACLAWNWFKLKGRGMI